MINIFDWVKDIEETYKFLTEKAKDDSLIEIRNYKKQQEMVLEELFDKKQEFVNLSLKTLSKEFYNEIKMFHIHFNQAINNIEEKYQKNKKKVMNLILKQLGLDF